MLLDTITIFNLEIAITLFSTLINEKLSPIFHIHVNTVRRVWCLNKTDFLSNKCFNYSNKKTSFAINFRCKHKVGINLEIAEKCCVMVGYR